MPTLFTQLVIGCRRKLVIYSWRDGEAQDVKVCTCLEFVFLIGYRYYLQEASLAHSPRAMAFFDHDIICLGYSPTEYAVFALEKLTVTEIVTPAQATTALTGMGAFSGLSGYMTLGLGAKPKPGILRLSETEVVIVKDSKDTISFFT